MSLKLRSDLDMLLSKFAELCSTYGSMAQAGNKVECEKYQALANDVQCQVLDEFHRLTSEQEVTEEWWSKNSELVQPSGVDLKILRVAETGGFVIVVSSQKEGPGPLRGLDIGRPSIEQLIRLSFALSKLEKIRRW